MNRTLSCAKIGGLAAFGAIGCHILAMALFTAGAMESGVDLAQIAGPPSVEVLAELRRMHGYAWGAVWIGIVSWLLMGVVVLGPQAVLAGKSTLAGPATALFYLGLAAGMLHFGPDAVYWTLLPDRMADATGPARGFYLDTAVVLRGVSVFFEKVWGLARGASILLFTLALVGAFRWRHWIVWVSAIGALEFVLRLPAIATNAPISFVFDATYLLWLLGIGIWLAFGGDPQPVLPYHADGLPPASEEGKSFMRPEKR